MQDLDANARPLLSPILSRQDSELARLSNANPAGKKLSMMVRRNSRSALTTRNRIEIQQDAATFYPSFIQDLKTARGSISRRKEAALLDRIFNASKCPPFVIYELRSNCAPLQTKVPAVLIVTAIYGTTRERRLRE